MEINKIYNIDCMELMSDIPDSSIDFVLTDIPYNISRENNFKTMMLTMFFVLKKNLI